MKKRKKITLWVRWSKKDKAWWVRGCWCPYPDDGGHKSPTKREAVAMAMGLALARSLDSVVELRICRKDGTIQESRTYPRSADPRRSKG